MSKPTFDRLGAVLDKADYEWLLADNEDLAMEVESQVIGGVEPDAIGRFVARRIGDHRVGTINRCIGAARRGICRAYRCVSQAQSRA